MYPEVVLDFRFGHWKFIGGSPGIILGLISSFRGFVGLELGGVDGLSRSLVF